LSPAYVEQTVRTIARLHAEHHQDASSFEQFTDRATRLLAHPLFIAAVTIIIVGWIAVNSLGYVPFDPPPFPKLGDAVALASFYMVLLILVTQRREDKLALHREQLILELVISSEQKTAKVIRLLEEFRRDDPSIEDRVDPEADDMAKPTDPSTVLEEIREVHAELSPPASR
jgi:uncharacterized membrane protein